MLLVKPKFRLVIHYIDKHDNYKRHGDLFLELPKYDKLITYEVDPYYLEILKKKYKYYYFITQDLNIKNYLNMDIPQYNSIQEIYNKHHQCDIFRIPITRKEDHRKDYLKIEGDLNNKGRLEEFTQSYLHGIVFNNMDAILVVDYD